MSPSLPEDEGERIAEPFAAPPETTSQEQLGHWYHRALAAESRYEKAKAALERIARGLYAGASKTALQNAARDALANLETEGE